MTTDPQILEWVAICGRNLHALLTPTSNRVLTDAARIRVRVFRTPGDVSRMCRNSTTPCDVNVVIIYPRLNSPVLNDGGTTASPTRPWIHEIVGSKGPTGSVEVRNSHIFNTSINENLAKNGDYTPIFSKVIRQELSNGSSTDIYLRCRVEFTSTTVGTKAPYFMHFELLAVNAADELRSFGTPTTRVGRPTKESKWSSPGYIFGEVTAAGLSRTTSEKSHSYKTYFVTRRENKDFGRQIISMSRPSLESTPFGTNTTNGTTSIIDLIPVRTKTPDPTPLTRLPDSPTLPKESPE